MIAVNILAHDIKIILFICLSLLTVDRIHLGSVPPQSLLDGIKVKVWANGFAWHKVHLPAEAFYTFICLLYEWPASKLSEHSAFCPLDL